jgi:large subunit ribosomal protein L30
MKKSFRVKLIKSISGSTKSQREAVRCLGLRRLQSEVVIKDNPANRGQIYKVHHLVDVTVE